jgi:hypothetical protein
LAASLHYECEGAMSGLNEFHEFTVTQIYLSDLRFQQIQSLVSCHTVEDVSSETFAEDKHPTLHKGKGPKS